MPFSGDQRAVPCAVLPTAPSSAVRCCPAADRLVVSCRPLQRRRRRPFRAAVPVCRRGRSRLPDWFGRPVCGCAADRTTPASGTDRLGIRRAHLAVWRRRRRRHSTPADLEPGSPLTAGRRTASGGTASLHSQELAVARVQAWSACNFQTFQAGCHCFAHPCRTGKEILMDIKY